MTRIYINAAVVLAFAAFSNAAVAEHYIFCRADTIHYYPGKTSCGWSSTESGACVTDAAMGTIDNVWLKNKATMPNRCPDNNKQVVRWTQPDKAPEPTQK
jgi:hypothetical protein